MCGPLSYDGHKGTDFALSSLAAQAKGVAVFAAAPGRVVGVRDGMADVLQVRPDSPDVSERECGNGVVIRHDDRWETQYCHLAKGSVTVTQNQIVAAGDTLGMIGLSGATQFPHLDITVRRNGKVVDPFAPNGAEGCSINPSETLWDTPLDVAQGGLISVGFSPSAPDFDVIKAGTAHSGTLKPDDALVIWGFAFGGRVGDVMELAITGPSGDLIREAITLERTQAQLFRAIGRRAPAGGWPQTIYSGIVTHIRDGIIIDQQFIQTVIR